MRGSLTKNLVRLVLAKTCTGNIMGEKKFTHINHSITQLKEKLLGSPFLIEQTPFSA
jgi:hypothetical protein